MKYQLSWWECELFYEILVQDYCTNYWNFEYTKSCNPTPFTAIEVGVRAQALKMLGNAHVPKPASAQACVCTRTSWLGHMCISKQFPSLGTPNFTAVVVNVGGDMGQDSATEVIHLGLNQPQVFQCSISNMEAHIYQHAH